MENLHLHGGIHTLSVLGSYTSAVNSNGIKTFGYRLDRETGEFVSSYKINPNSFAFCNDQYLNSFKEFKATMEEIKTSCLKSDYKITRVDFRIDNYSDEYAKFFKINKIVILLLARKLNINNQWQSYEPIKLYNKTIRVQNKFFEMEYYDRYDKTKKNGLTKARLELRNKALNCQIKDIPLLINQWRDLLKSIISEYASLQDIYNEELIKLWEYEKTFNKKISIIDFVKSNRDNICTTTQLQKLLLVMGAKNPTKLSYKYTHLACIELISENELKKYVNIIIKALIGFREKI